MKKFTCLLSLVFVAQACYSTLWAQGCSMCTATANNLDGKAAAGLNMGIVYLGMIPLILLGTLFFKWYKANKQQAES